MTTTNEHGFTPRGRTHTPRLHLPATASLLTAAPASGSVRVLDIGVDLDGVVYDYVHALRMWIHSITGRPLASMSAPTCWNFFDVDWGISLADFLQFNHDAVNAAQMFRYGTPLPGVIEGLTRLRAAGHRVHIITDRGGFGLPGIAEQNTRIWLNEEGVPFDTLTVSKDKTAVHCDTFIDDRPENYLSLVDAGVDTFMRDHPYNRHVDVPANRRVLGFTEFADAVLDPSFELAA